MTLEEIRDEIKANSVHLPKERYEELLEEVLKAPKKERMAFLDTVEGHILSMMQI